LTRRIDEPVVREDASLDPRQMQRQAEGFVCAGCEGGYEIIGAANADRYQGHGKPPAEVESERVEDRRAVEGELYEHCIGAGRRGLHDAPAVLPQQAAGIGDSREREDVHLDSRRRKACGGLHGRVVRD
jgi:hypothetical protein